MALTRIGTAGWSIPAPLRPGFPASGTQLEKYAARLNAVEINSSFYRPHQRKTYERWAASVPGDFRFSVKLPRSITHERRLRDFEAPLTRFLEEISGLGGKLDVILMQLPPSLSFDGDVANALFATLAGYKVACEPRHGTWFNEDADILLRRHAVARVAADPPRHPEDGKPGGDCHLAYYRWHGAPRIYWSAYADARLAGLARTVQTETAKETWCIFDNTGSGAALNDALRLTAMGTKAEGIPLHGASKEELMARKYSKGASKKVEKAMHERKKGTLRSGSGKKVKSKKQAIAIGLSEARKEGKKVPKKKGGKKKKSSKSKKSKKKD